MVLPAVVQTSANVNVVAWEEGDKKRTCGGSVRNVYAGGSGAEEEDRQGWSPSSGRTEQKSADPSVSTPETGVNAFTQRHGNIGEVS